jgi:hypothetical protein
MKRWTRSLKNLLLGCTAAAALLLSTSDAWADKVVLKNGTVIEGTIVEDDALFIRIKRADGKVEIVDKSDVSRVERDAKPEPKKEEAKPADAKKDEAKPAEPAKDEPATTSGKKPEVKKARAVSGATRVAILNFGPPSSWQGKVESTVGVQVNSKAWRDVMPMLEKDNVDVVVVRVNSGGGYLFELEKFHDVFREYKRKWRTVVWVESAISAACMSPWIIEEWYFMPEGSAGANTGWSGNLVMMKGTSLSQVLYMMEKVSKEAKRDPKIMRSMQIVEPLSANIDDQGNVSWFQDNSGQYQVNPGGQILTFTARDAFKFKFSRGTAATPEELVKVMGLNEAEFAGKAAAEYIDKNMRDNDTAEKKWEETATKYEMAISAARSLADRERRMVEVGVAKRHLTTLEKLLSVNPMLVELNLPPGWLEQQKQLIKDLSR